MTLPSGVRRKNMAIWRELRPMVNRADWTFKGNRKDLALYYYLCRVHSKGCDDCLDRANRIREGKAIPDDNPIQKDLERLGLA